MSLHYLGKHEPLKLCLLSHTNVSKTTLLCLAISSTLVNILIIFVDNKVVLLSTVCKYYFWPGHFLCSVWLTHGRVSRRASLTKPLTSREYGCVHAEMQEVVTMNICYNQLVTFRATRPHVTTGSFESHRHFPGEDICLWRIGLLTFGGSVDT